MTHDSTAVIADQAELRHDSIVDKNCSMFECLLSNMAKDSAAAFTLSLGCILRSSSRILTFSCSTRFSTSCPAYACGTKFAFWYYQCTLRFEHHYITGGCVIVPNSCMPAMQGTVSLNLYDCESKRSALMFVAAAPQS